MLHQKEDQLYTVLDQINSSVLLTEEREILFRKTFGAHPSYAFSISNILSQREIDFSVYKFRKQAQIIKGRVLICRIVSPIQSNLGNIYKNIIKKFVYNIDNNK